MNFVNIYRLDKILKPLYKHTMRKLLIMPSFILNDKSRKISYPHCKYSCISIYGSKPNANHLMPVFQHTSNPKKPQGVQHNATLNKNSRRDKLPQLP